MLAPCGWVVAQQPAPPESAPPPPQHPAPPEAAPPPPQAQGAPAGAATTPPAEGMKDARQPSGSERRRAAKLFLAAAKLYEKEQFEAALDDYHQAAALDPANEDYQLAAEVARAHAVTALIQAAAKRRIQGDTAGARAALVRAFDIDPHSDQVAQHVREQIGRASCRERV